MTNAIETEVKAAEPAASPSKPGRKAGKKAASAKKAARTRGAKPGKKGDAVERSNKKAEVIALMKRAKGVTLAEIIDATGWQKHTVRGFVSILGNKGGEKIESAKNAAGDRTYRITK